ncbi:LysR substrate-binding domain-containing protein [Streptomyces sp. NPDC091217]|uniref:LysR substrate-binding domain-containing protein n=1 Tax=Streptomyces sp. NPDC091217 TaxID=3365975 RepID=UPI00382DE420
MFDLHRLRLLRELKHRGTLAAVAAALSYAPSSVSQQLSQLRSLADHPWVMEPEGTPARHWAMTLCRKAGFEPDVRFETTDLLLHLRLVEQQHAAAFLPDLVWSGRLPTLALRQLPRGQRTRRVFTVVRSGRSRHPAVLACREALRQAVTLHPSRASVQAAVSAPQPDRPLADTHSGNRKVR